MRQNPMTTGDDSPAQKIRRRLTGGDPRSIRDQAMTAAGLALVSYLLFFVFTRGTADISAEKGNIVAEHVKKAPLAKTVTKPSKQEESRNLPSSGLNVVARVARGVSEDDRKAQLVKLTKHDYENFFRTLEGAGRKIEKHVQSPSGSKAACEMRYRSFDAVVKTILSKHSNVFAHNRSLASKWQDVKKAVAGVYRISYHSFAMNDNIGQGATWYTSIAQLAFRSGEPPFDRPYIAHKEAIATARERLFDQRLTVGEYEAVLAANTFADNVHEATKNAHEVMDTFYDALVSLASTDKFVRYMIRNKPFGMNSFTIEDELLASFRTSYDMRRLLEKGEFLEMPNEETIYGKFANVLCNPPYATTVENVNENDREKMKHGVRKPIWLRHYPLLRRRSRNP